MEETRKGIPKRDPDAELVEAIEDISCCSNECCGHAGEKEKALRFARAAVRTNTEDDDPDNMLVRAGYLQALARSHEGEDRAMLEQAARSLLCAAAARRE